MHSSPKMSSLSQTSGILDYLEGFNDDNLHKVSTLELSVL